MLLISPVVAFSRSTARPFRSTPSSPSQSCGAFGCQPATGAFNTPCCPSATGGIDYLASTQPRSHCQATSGGNRKLRRSIVPSFGHDRPGDARHFVGDGDRDNLDRLLRQQSSDPRMLLRMAPGVLDHRCCAHDEWPSQIAIALLGNAAELLLAALRILSRHEPDPGCEIATRLEGARASDRRGDRRGPDHADSRDRFEAAALPPYRSSYSIPLK